MDVKIIPIKSLSNNSGQIPGLPKNPRILKDYKFEKLKKSIQDDPEMLSLREVIAYDNGGELIVICGNMRLKALKELGINEVPTKILPQDTPVEKLKAYTIKDNVGFGEHDWDALANEWDAKQLEDWGMDLPGFEVVEEAKEDDYEVPETLATDIVIGDLFEIGQHRLLCGDSTDSDAVAKLMNGEKADIAFTSPPYNAAKNSHLNGRVKGFDEKYQEKNDAKTDDEYLQFLSSFTNNTILFSDYSFVNIQLLAQNKIVLIDYQYQMKSVLKDILIWNKSQCPPNIVKGAFNTKWEYLFCFSNKNETRGFPCKWQGKFPNVIETENASSNEFASIHKATFPISFPVWIIEKMDFANSVLDLFCGTGTTMVASHQLNRKCYGMELEPKYCQVIVDRMLKLDPSLKVYRNGKPYVVKS